MDTANDILARVAAAWEPFWAAVTERRNAMDEKTPAGWSGKEMLAHIAFWDEAVVPVVVTMFRGASLPSGWAFGSGDLGLHSGQWPSADVHNARESAWARGRSAPEVLERCDRAHRQLVTLLHTVTDQEAVEHRDYFRTLGTHYQEHLVDVTSP
jgi:hypothetical protein